ncbi:uncharacterized protein BXZ73DRAFT_108799 [Epithele typhae]|uniref:uncharacterized protein n=1 Tax=Epithele typhae TaxID=378194 RepID=UPI002008C45D|nr:uncharacterized protein BXZ73DRAFT_108799 [Epithele typhae]KAH9910566.1 hypothetical protein BXZ73DRAFT_108799 [Epithele typhae]
MHARRDGKHPAFGAESPISPGATGQLLSRSPSPDPAYSPPLYPADHLDNIAPSSPTRSGGHRESEPPDEDNGLPPRPALRDLTQDPSERLLAPATIEAPQFRLIYLLTVIDNAFKHTTVADCDKRLKDHLNVIKIMQPLPIAPRKPATTLATAHRRLGLNIDNYFDRVASDPHLT